jgi:hypothetical protein
VVSVTGEICATCGAPVMAGPSCGTCGAPYDAGDATLAGLDIPTVRGVDPWPSGDHPTLHPSQLPPKLPGAPEPVRYAQPVLPARPVAPPSVTGPARRPRAGLVVVLALAFVALAGGGATAAFVMLSGDAPAAVDDTSTDAGAAAPGRVDDVTPVPDAPVADEVAAIDSGASVLSAPGNEWTFDVDDVLPGGELGATVLVEGAYPAPLVLDDVVVGLAESYADGSERRVMFGVDSSSGDLLWTDDEGTLTSGCVAVQAATRILCPADRDVALVDPYTGSVLARADLTADWFAAADAGATTYVVGARISDGESQTSVAVAALDAELDVIWERPLDLSIVGLGGGLFDITVTAGVLTIGWLNATWFVDARSGDLISADDGSTGWGYDTYLVDDEGGTTYVVDLDGNAILTVDGTAWGLFAAQAPDGLAGIDDGVWDLGTGTAVWRRPDLGDQPWWSWSAEGRFVVASDDDGWTSVLDPRTGATVGELALGDPVVGFSGDAALAVDESGGLSVRDLATGTLTWSRDLTDVVEPDEFPVWETTLDVGRHAVVFAGPRGIHGFTDFGPAPGAAPVGGEGTSYLTACGSLPELTPVASQVANGGVRVTFEVVATCSGGHWWSDSAVGLRLASAAGSPFAAGVVDLSTRPRWIPDADDGGTTLDVVFPFRHTFATAEEIADAVASDTILVDCEEEPVSEPGSVPSHPSYGASPDEPVPADAAPGSEPGSADDDAQQDALAALQRIAAEDEGSVTTDLENRWVPQLSSKLQGTADDGIVYDYTDILAEHLRLRARYEDVRLVFSSDWGSFLVDGYWVTVVGDTSLDPEPANAWCDARAFAPGKCYAKRIVRDGVPEGNTRNRS